MSLEQLIKSATDEGAIIDSRIKFEYTENSGISAFILSNDNDTLSKEKPLTIDIPNSFIIKPQDAYNDLKINENDLESTIAFKFYIAALKTGIIENSKFQSYIDLLPSIEQIHSPLSLPEKSLYVYENTTLEESYIKEKIHLLKVEFNKGSKLIPYIKFNDHLWAHLITTSRAFPYRIINPTSKPHEFMLLPIIDLLNHKPNSKVEWLSSDKNNFKISCINQLSNSDDIDDSKIEIFNNYGPKGNAELLMGYGFTLEGNEYDSLQLSLSVNDEIKNGLSNLWNIHLPTISDYTFSINDDEETEKTVAQNAGENNKVIFLINKFHPIPDGLLEVFCYISKNEDDKGMSLKNTMNGLNKLKQSLEIKYSNKLDKVPSFDKDLIDENDYNNAKTFRKGQLKIYNLTKNEIKNKEKQLLKEYRKCFITIKDIFKKDDEFSEFLEILQWNKDVSELNKMEMELILRLWLLKNVNYYNEENVETEFENFDIKWFLELFKFRKGLDNVGAAVSDDDFMVDLYNQIIPAFQNNVPELLKGDQWSLNDWLIIDQLVIDNSYEKGKSLEPLLITPTIL